MNFYEENKQVQSVELVKIDVYTKSVFIVLEVNCERFFIDLQHLAKRVKHKLQPTV